jgi:hypothetical protein
VLASGPQDGAFGYSFYADLSLYLKDGLEIYLQDSLKVGTLKESPKL